MEVAVRVVLGQFVSGRNGLAHIGQAGTDVGQWVQVLGTPQREGLSGGMPLEQTAQIEQLGDVGRCQLGDPGPAARQLLDQALIGQRAQRLPERSPADGEAAADLLLDQALTGFQLAGQDFGPEPASGHLDEAGQVQRLRVQLGHRHLLAPCPPALCWRSV